VSTKQGQARTALAARGAVADDEIVDFAVQVAGTIVLTAQVKGSADPVGNEMFPGKPGQVDPLRQRRHREQSSVGQQMMFVEADRDPRQVLAFHTARGPRPADHGAVGPDVRSGNPALRLFPGCRIVASEV
jgi:hypothetical protein